MLQQQAIEDYSGGGVNVYTGGVSKNSLGETISGEDYIPAVLVKKPFQSIIQESQDMELPLPKVGTSIIAPSPLDILPKELPIPQITELIKLPVVDAPIGVSYGTSTPFTESTIPNYGDATVPVPETPVIFGAPEFISTQPPVVSISEISEPIQTPNVNLGSSIVNPNPIDTLPVKAPIEQVLETSPTATPIVDIPTAEPIVKEAITVPKEETTSNITTAPVDTVAKTSLNILSEFPNMSGSNKSQFDLKKKNETYWLYVIGGALVLGYFLMKKKPSKN